MKKLFTKPGIYGLFFAIMIFPSCQKQIDKTLPASFNSPKSLLKNEIKVDVENGIIIFKNFGDYNSTIKKLSNLTGSERTNWENSLSGFVSYDSACNIALNALDNATTIKEANNVVEKYQDLLTVSHINGEVYYEFIVNPNLFTNVANKNGMYIVGGVAYRVLGEYLLRTDRKMINSLLSIHYQDIENKTMPSEVSIEKYCSKSNIIQNNLNSKPIMALDPIGGDSGGGNVGGGSTYSSWVPYCRDTIVQNENHTSMRIVKLELRTYSQTEYLGNGTPSGEVYYANVQAYGLKLSIFRAWRVYNTEIKIEGTNPNGNDFSVQTPWGIYQYDIPLCTSPGDVKYFTLPHPDYGYNKPYDVYPGPDVYIISAHLKAWTRGTTESYSAEINYER